MFCLTHLENLIQVKADVETQGDFVQSLAAEVRTSSFTNIQDLVAFVNWLDEELSFLVFVSTFFCNCSLILNLLCNGLFLTSRILPN